MIGTKFMKNAVDWDNYAEVAQWCNKNNATIIEQDDCYEVVALPEPEAPTNSDSETTEAKEIEQGE